MAKHVEINDRDHQHVLSHESMVRERVERFMQQPNEVTFETLREAMRGYQSAWIFARRDKNP